MTEKLDSKNDSLYPFQTYTFRNTSELERICPQAFNMMLNPEHEHELWLGNINGLVSPTSEYGLAIKLKCYLLAGKKLTFVLPENYEAIRPDNNNIGFRKTVLDMIRLGESKGLFYIKIYSVDNHEDDINKILKDYEGDMPKFDVAIMNPPYDGNLHLKILEKVIPLCKQIINISPVRWLQDPFAPYNNKSDYCKFEKTISQKIESLNIISAKKASTIFNAQFAMNLGIYVCGNGGYNYKHTDVLVNKIVEKTLQNNWMPYNQKDFYKSGCIQKKPYMLNVSGIRTGDTDTTRVVCKIYDNQCNVKLTNKKSAFTGGVGVSSTHFEFNTEAERYNFWKCYNHPFMLWTYRLWKIDQNIKAWKVPYFDYYDHAWDYEDFFNWFGLTAEERVRVINEIAQMYTE